MTCRSNRYVADVRVREVRGCDCNDPWNCGSLYGYPRYGSGSGCGCGYPRYGSGSGCGCGYPRYGYGSGCGCGYSRYGCGCGYPRYGSGSGCGCGYPRYGYGNGCGCGNCNSRWRIYATVEERNGYESIRERDGVYDSCDGDEYPENHCCEKRK